MQEIIIELSVKKRQEKGYADFIFHPRRKNDIALILELKKNSTPEEAIKQIKEICSKIYTRK